MPEALKDRYNIAYVKRLGNAMHKTHAEFNPAAFTRTVFQKDWDNLELKQRMRRISSALHACLPLPYKRQLAVLKKVAPEFTGFEALLFPDFIEQFGLEHFEESISALEQFTQYSSAEFAVRPFIKRYGGRMMEVMSRWASHRNEHVRRLASEGSRPRLPWGMALPAFKKDPSPTLPILEKLAADSSEYVRRSVANHLNDIAKDHPELLLTISKRWLGKNAHTDRLVKHACRTLLKRGDAVALSLFGFKADPAAKIRDFILGNDTLRIGENLSFGFALHNTSAADRQLRLEYAIDFVKARGTSRKVFKVTETILSPKSSRIFKRTHRFCDFTTRTHYPGVHQITILINGIPSATHSVLLKKA